MDICDIIYDLQYRECDIPISDRDAILNFLRINHGWFYLGNGNVAPAEDTDNWTFIDENNNSIFFGYRGCDSYIVSYKDLSYDPQDEMFYDISDEKHKIDHLIENELTNNIIWYSKII